MFFRFLCILAVKKPQRRGVLSMKHPKREPEEAFQEEFAFDLTPNVDGGAASRMHRRRSGAPRPDQDKQRARSGPDAAPDDVEWGPNVRGCGWSVT